MIKHIHILSLSIATSILLTNSAFAQEGNNGSGIAIIASDEIETITVTAKQSPYLRLSESATKTQLSNFDTPLSVTVLNETFLEDLRSETLSDAYPYTLAA